MLTHAQRSLTREGFAPVRRFLDPPLTDRLRRQGERVVEETGDVPGCERPHNVLVPLRWDNAIVDCILEDGQRRRVIREASGGEDLRWISAYLSVKEPFTPALWWHQDWWCWNHPVSFRPAAPQVALLVYLSETSEENGALRVLPGSHHASVPLHATLAEAHEQGADLSHDHPAMSDHPGQRTLSLEAGDAVMLDYRLLHGTHPNPSPRRRNAVLLSFTPSWKGLPTEMRAHLIQHPALPRNDERVPWASWRAELLPSFDSAYADLPLRRIPPVDFQVPSSDRAAAPRGAAPTIASSGLSPCSMGDGRR